jgi:protein-S-isoprenylcysteine O-methyltransferase Ste14
MSLGTFVLFLLAYAIMGSLPFTFFRRAGVRGFNFMWCLTGSPYMVGPTLLILAFLGKITPLTAGSPVAPWLEAVGVVLATASIALQVATVAIHRIPLALWHQENDAPQQIVTWGPYMKVRHPFYVSFLLLSLGTVIALPHVGTVACLLFALGILNATAAREEKRLLASNLGGEYAAYLKRTGRFFPRLSSAS